MDGRTLIYCCPELNSFSSGTSHSDHSTQTTEWHWPAVRAAISQPAHLQCRLLLVFGFHTVTRMAYMPHTNNHRKWNVRRQNWLTLSCSIGQVIAFDKRTHYVNALILGNLCKYRHKSYKLDSRDYSSMVDSMGLSVFNQFGKLAPKATKFSRITHSCEVQNI